MQSQEVFYRLHLYALACERRSVSPAVCAMTRHSWQFFLLASHLACSNDTDAPLRIKVQYLMVMSIPQWFENSTCT